MSAEIVKRKSPFSVAIKSEVYQKLINQTLGDPERAKRFIASISSAVAVNPALQECTAATILSGALLGESLNLSPSPQLGQFYLVPFKDKVKDANGRIVYDADANGDQVARTESHAVFVLGYKGYVQLAIRSGYYKNINVLEVKAGEFISYNPFTEEFNAEFTTDPEAREKLPTVGYVAMFEYLNGFRKILYWTKEKMIAHADTYSKAFSAEAYRKILDGKVADKDMWKYSSFWYKDFDSMGKKTMLRQLISHWGIMTPEMQTAFERDDTVGDVQSGTYEEPEGEDEPIVSEEPVKVNLDEI